MQIDIFQLGVTDVLNFAIYSKKIENLQEDKDLLRDILVTKKEALNALLNAKSNNFAIHLSFETTEDFCDLMQIVSFLNDFGKGFILEITLNNSYVISEE